MITLSIVQLVLFGSYLVTIQVISLAMVFIGTLPLWRQASLC